MRVKKEVVIPEKIEERLDYIECDLCGNKEGKSEIFYSSGWGGLYEVKRTNIFICEGHSYPDSGNETALFADVCFDCMKEKVIPCLEAIGVKFHEDERDW